MPLPTSIQSGSFFPAVQDGEDIIDFPFAQWGDFSTVIISRQMVVAYNKYSVPQIGAAEGATATKSIAKSRQIPPPFGVCYLVGRQSPVLDKGGRVLRYTDVFANIPLARLEPIEFAHTCKVLGAGLTTGITTIKKCYNLYEYSLNYPLPPMEAVDWNDATFLAGGTIRYFTGDWVPIASNSSTTLGSNAFNYNLITSSRRQISVLKDSEISTWKGNIFQRVTLIGRYQLFGQESTPGAPTA